MKRILLFVSLFFLVVVAFLGCHKDPIEFGNVGVLNLSLQRGYKTNNKAALESFDARVTIYYSTEDTIGYNCRFTDIDGDGRYINDPKELDCIYVRRDVGFWVGVWTVIQGDTVMGMSDPTNLLYLSEENPVLDVTIVLEAGYPRIVVNQSAEFDGERLMLYGTVLEGAESIDQYYFFVKQGQPTDEEKRLWATRNLTDMDYEALLDSYEPVDAVQLENDANRFYGQMDIFDSFDFEYGLDSLEISVVAIASLNMDDGDSVPNVIHSQVVCMKINVRVGDVQEIYEQEDFFDYSSPTAYVDGYGYVDLGLPSGTLWAYCNLGATSPYLYGNYYAWGETTTKQTYSWATYQYCNGDSASLTKYCSNSAYGNGGFTDRLTTLESSDDAATVNRSSNWRMPTLEEFQELTSSCSHSPSTQNGVVGHIFRGPNGNSIFLPAAGSYDEGSFYDDQYGYYWTNTLYSNEPYKAYPLYFYDTSCFMDDENVICNRRTGLSIRPVCVQSKKKK
ncbi:MAG: DUF1566 domain-containing protein [Bacteroidales bacterium]|nr:DUF1566 domain-containing protein [Bacteroidales bacterium]